MKILVVGQGGREHAIVDKMVRDGDTVISIPGNPGISKIAECHLAAVDDVDALLAIARLHRVDLTVFGPEVPLVRGGADVFHRAGMRVVGPFARASQLEGSKAFCRVLLKKYGISYLEFAVFDNPLDAEAYIRAQDRRDSTFCCCKKGEMLI